MKRLGLRGRVTLAAVAALAAALLLASLGFNLLLTDRLDADASTVLSERVDAELDTLDTTGGRIRAVEATGPAAVDAQTWVFTPTRTLEAPKAGAEAQRAARALAGVRAPAERKVGERLELRAEPIYGPDGRRQLGVVVVGISLLPYEHTERIARIATVVLDLLILLAMALAVRFAVGAALRPVAEMTERAADWSEHDLHRRFDLGRPRDELTALAATLDGLLGRIDAALRHEQRLSAEIAHELRTPLSGVRARGELALAEGSQDSERREAIESMLRGTDRMEAAIDALLTSARPPGPPGTCDPHDPLLKAVEGVDGGGVEVSLSGPPREALVHADADLVLQAAKPLIENAVRHARANVTVWLEPSAGGVTVVVADDGPGLREADAKRIFEPGVSLRDGGGGLGLSLARRVARACGGEVLAAPGPTGRFELRLPGAFRK